MKRLLKQVFGIDCAKDDFQCSFGLYTENTESEIKGTIGFKNTLSGFKLLEAFVKKNMLIDVPLFFVMEATGVYHEKLACFLYDKGYNICIVLPNRAKSFMKTLKTKTITDKESSKGLTIMGLEKKLDVWHKPKEVFIKLRRLTREREQIQRMKTQAMNQKHAETSSAWKDSIVIKRLNQIIQLFESQIIQIEKEIKELVMNDSMVSKKINTITSIPGLGLLTVATVVAETNGFNLIANKNQLISYSGYDIVERTSGTSIRGKTKISHKGNRHIRRAMHMPALSAINSCPYCKSLFNRIVSKTGIKMKGVVAVQRKQLELIYILWKNEEKYDRIKREKGRFNESALTELDQVCSIESFDSVQI